jgi:alkylated DNA repair dioxygenase AlkB
MSTSTAWLAPEPVVERVALDDQCWVDVVRGVIPHAQQVHDELARDVRWRTGRTYRYERWVDDVRRSATQSGARRHPALVEVETWLMRRYRVRFSGVVLSEYRHGREALGFHRDRAMTWLDDTLVALLSLGAQRPWLMRPDSGRPVIDPDDALRDAIDLSPAGGDLLVMGGRCQRSWLHAVPPVSGAVHSRISAQWRWTSRRGEPDSDPTSRDPRFFSGAAPVTTGRRSPPTRFAR